MRKALFSIHTGSKWISVDPISLLSVGSTEKAPGMFATLVIALPSEHTGGDVIVQLRDEEHTLSTQKKCDFGYEYLAWYADVNHSVQKITSGHVSRIYSPFIPPHNYDQERIYSHLSSCERRLCAGVGICKTNAVHLAIGVRIPLRQAYFDGWSLSVKAISGT